MDFKNLDKIVRYQGGLNRRFFMSYFSALATIPLIGLSGCTGKTVDKFRKNPFSLGVASGDPDHEGMVLWTKLAPEPLELDGGMPQDSSAWVTWEMASDEGMKNIVQSGKKLATPQLGHSIHVETKGLKSDRWYWFRFRVGGYESAIGRTRTTPQEAVMAKQLRFAVTSCQHFEQGLYTGYEQMVADNPDLVFHLGDYIYEYAGNKKRIRTHIGPEIETLPHYRRRYNQYRTDVLLQKIHASCSWVVTWDDHEFDNNYANQISEQRGVDIVAFLKRRAAAYQAYYEMMPLRNTSIPVGPDMKLYRRSNYGSLADFLVLDTRQYRSDQPNGDGKKELNKNALDPKNSLLGKKQKQWMTWSLKKSESRWNVLAQQIMMGMVNRQVRPNQRASYSMDQWPGAAAEKQEIMRFYDQHNISNPVVLTGDIHSNWANELRVDDLKPETKRVAVEFVVTSLSSGGNGSQSQKYADMLKSKNPCVKFFNAERGYILCDVTPNKWVSHYKVISDVLRPGGKTSTRASFQVNSGDSKVHKI